MPALNSIKLRMATYGVLSGNCYLQLTGVDGTGLPTGAVLATSASVDLTDLVDGFPLTYSDATFTFSDPTISMDTWYDAEIILDSVVQDSESGWYVALKKSGLAYTGGGDARSINSDNAGTWYTYPLQDAREPYTGTVNVDGEVAITESNNSFGLVFTSSTPDMRSCTSFILQSTSPAIISAKLGAEGSFILCTSETGIYVSEDFGTSWAQILPDEDEAGIWSMGSCSGDGEYMIVVRDSDSAIYWTDDTGASWEELDPSDGESFTIVDLDISDTGQYMLVVGTNATDSTHTAYRSANYGATWSAINPEIVGGNYNWTECQISNDGKLIALSRSGAAYLSFDAGTNWEAASIPSSDTNWDCLAISGDGTAGIIANLNDGDEFFQNSGWYRKPTISETTITETGRSLLDDDSPAVMASTLGLGTADSPQFTGLTLSSLTASRLVATNSSKVLTSVANLASWIAGTANEISVADDGDGTITIGLVDPLIVGKGGSGAATLTDHGILLGSGTDAITPLGAATNGQIPIGSTGADPVLAAITQGSGITITNGAGSITVASSILYGGMYTVTDIARVLTTQNVWYEMDAAQPWITGTLNGVTFTDPYLTIVTAGTYWITWNMSCRADAATQLMVGGIMIDQTNTDGPASGSPGVQSAGRSSIDFLNSGRRLSIGGSAILTLAAGRKVSLAARNTTSAGKTITVGRGNLNVMRIGA